MALDKDDTLEEANFLMGKLYEEGLSVDSNIKNAIKYY
jgi:TPR repeat protein